MEWEIHRRGSLQQQVLALPGNRLSAHDLAGNQLRLWLATLAYLPLERWCRVYLRGRELARATVGTIRLRLLKVAAKVRVSARRVTVQLSSAFPLPGLFRQVARRLGTEAVPGAARCAQNRRKTGCFWRQRGHSGEAVNSF